MDGTVDEITSRLAASLPSAGAPPVSSDIASNARSAAIDGSIVARRELAKSVATTAARAALARTRSGDYLVVVGRDDKGLVALAQSTDPRVAGPAPHCRRKQRCPVFKTLWECAPVIAYGRKLSRGEAMSSSSHPQRAGLEGRRSIASRLSHFEPPRAKHTGNRRTSVPIESPCDSAPSRGPHYLPYAKCLASSAFLLPRGLVPRASSPRRTKAGQRIEAARGRGDRTSSAYVVHAMREGSLTPQPHAARILVTLRTEKTTRNGRFGFFRAGNDHCAPTPRTRS